MATVLIVGAEPEQQRDLQQPLGAAGYDVSVVGDATDPFDDPGLPRPDLLVVDLEGWKRSSSSARALRRRFPQVPLLGIAPTRRLDDEVRCVAEMLGAQCVLLRPFDAERMVDLACKILSGGLRIWCGRDQLEGGATPEPRPGLAAGRASVS